MQIGGPAIDWGIMPLKQRLGRPWRTGQIDAQSQRRARRYRPRNDVGAGDRRHFVRPGNIPSCRCLSADARVAQYTVDRREADRPLALAGPSPDTPKILMFSTD